MNSFLIFILLILGSCNVCDIAPSNYFEEDKEHIVRLNCNGSYNNELPSFLWKNEFIDNALAASINPIIDGNRILISRSADLKLPDELLCFSLVDGQILWIWSDYFQSNEIIGNTQPIFVKNELMYLNSYGSIYVIDLKTGVTNYRYKYGEKDNFGTYGDGNLVSFTYASDTSKIGALINLDDLSLINFTSFPKSEHYKGSISVPFISNKSCYFSYNYFYFETKSNLSVLHRVDIQNNDTIFKWKRDIPGKGTLGNFGYQLLGNKLYVIDRDLYCININDGSIIWQQPEIYGGPAGLLIADRKLIVGSNHVNPSLMAFDLLTGDLLWKESLSGTASPLQYYNCVIYTVGGGDGLLHAIDVNSGEHLYKMESPDVKQNANLYFDNCTVDPASNSIVLTNFKFVMRYELPEY